MTVLNVWVGCDRAVVAVDTLAVDADGQAREFSKLLVLPHAPCLLAGRGNLDMLRGAFGWCHHQGLSFDEIAACLGRALPDVFGQLQALAEVDSARGGPTPEQELVAVGWSQAMQRMRAVRWFRSAGPPASWLETEVDAWMVAPWHADLGSMRPKDLESQAGMLALAREQVKLFRSLRPRAGFGGRLVLAEIDRRGCSMGHLDLYPASVAEILA